MSLIKENVLVEKQIRRNNRVYCKIKEQYQKRRKDKIGLK